MTRRREFLATLGAGVAGLTAGCSGGGGEPTETTAETTGTTETTTETAEPTTGTTTGTAADEPTTLTVATYESFTGEGTAGAWLKENFEAAQSEYAVEFQTPENGVNEFIRRAQRGVDIEPDGYIGLNTGELVRVDERLDDPLFDGVEADLDNAGHVREELRIDPDGRAVPYDTGYITLVYDATALDSEPTTFDDLLAEEFAGDLIVQNAQSSDPGRAFVLWTVAERGPESYLDYWSGLVDNDVRVLEDWQPAYNAWSNGEAPVVVSYSTDQVFYYDAEADELTVDPETHTVGFLNDQGYANPEAMARFADADEPEGVAALFDYALSREAQSTLPVENVQFPATDWAEPPEWFERYAFEPPEPVTFTYDELAGNVEGWIDDWARQVVSG
jgi:thiamine transport system substrate-binding protein